MKRLLFALLAVVAAAAAVAVAVPLLSPGHVVAVNQDVFVNAPKLVDANNSPTLLRNPLLPSNLVLSRRIDRPAFSAVLDSSLDGGVTWQATVLPLPPGFDRPFAPDLAFSPDGTLFVSYVSLEGDGNTPGSLWLTSSKDGGRTLADPVQVAGKLTFQARVVVDQSRNVHMTWLQVAEVGTLRVVGGPNPVVAVRSTDGGQTFTEPVVVSDADRERVGAATPVVDANNDLVVLYQDYKDDRRDFEFLEGPAWENPFALVLTRSGDGGQTFTPGVEVDSEVVATGRFLVFLPEFPSLAVGPDNTLFVAWSDGRAGDADVYLRRSQDGGQTWQDPVRVNDTPLGDGTSQYLPRVAVAPGGRVDVLYLDRRSDPDDRMTEASLATSHDGGQTFATTTVSSAAFDSRVGPVIDESIGVDFGSRLGLISSDAGAVMAWTDSRQGNEDTGRQDIAATSASVATEALDQTRLRLALGLLVLAFAGLAGWLATGRRPGPGPVPEPDQPDRPPAEVPAGAGS